MPFEYPKHEQIKAIAEEFGMEMNREQIDEYLRVINELIADYETVESMGDFLPTVKYPRDSGFIPPADKNPFNAWHVKTNIRGATEGPLVGKEVALKDNICVAEVPMINGASTMDGYVPDVDATIVTRILDAGGTIAGKAHCEYLCGSGSSFTNALATVQNPHRKGYSAGGSSSGSGALVGGGIVDMAIGGDQGGSIRIPAAWSGCYGMKPTYGLVPYTGVMPVDNSIDHVGPMTQTVVDNATLLQVIAGEDGLDPRQNNPQVHDYVGEINCDINSLKIGVLTEGFCSHGAEPDVESKVRNSTQIFEDLGAKVEEVSIPMHRQSAALWTPIALEGTTNQMMIANALGTGWKGLYVTSLQDFHAKWRDRVDQLDSSVVISMLLGQYFQKHYNGIYYARAQNLSRKLCNEYDAVLSEFDLLLMPTVPMKATPIPRDDAPLSLYIQRTFEMGANTCAADLTGHPAMSIPCGMSDGLPVGLMLVGSKWQESTVYKAAYAFEQSGDWKSR